ncbi:hypothetical protein AKKGGB_AKKGGB_14630, partial [Dysosmobacter welbionis]
PETAAGSAGGPGCRTRRYGPPPGILPPPWGRNAPPSGPEGAGSRRTNPPFPLQSASLPPVAVLFSTLYLDRPAPRCQE